MSAEKTNSPARQAFSRFRRDKFALLGAAGIVFLILPAFFAPFLANGRPLLLIHDGAVSFPALRFFFAPDSAEIIIERIFNFCALAFPVIFLSWFLPGKISRPVRIAAPAALCLCLALPFFLIHPKMDKTDWRGLVSAKVKEGKSSAVFAPVPYGPFEVVAAPYAKPSREHWLGADQIGRDVLSRMIYGARISLAVGLASTAVAMLIGCAVGMASGYFGGAADIIVMRLVEILICFPTFLLLLILMALMMDCKCEQSIAMVIAVLGLTGWTGLCRLVRGETLRQRAMPYIMSCEGLGIPPWRIILFHLFPNITGVALVAFSFGVAGAIIAESGLSFLGFGVREPAASWGELLRQAFADPLAYWHLTLWPGLALFIAISAFNFTGEGLRRAFDPKG